MLISATGFAIVRSPRLMPLPFAFSEREVTPFAVLIAAEPERSPETFSPAMAARRPRSGRLKSIVPSGLKSAVRSIAPVNLLSPTFASRVGIEVRPSFETTSAFTSIAWPSRAPVAVSFASGLPGFAVASAVITKSESVRPARTAPLEVTSALTPSASSGPDRSALKAALPSASASSLPRSGNAPAISAVNAPSASAAEPVALTVSDLTSSALSSTVPPAPVSTLPETVIGASNFAPMPGGSTAGSATNWKFASAVLSARSRLAVTSPRKPARSMAKGSRRMLSSATVTVPFADRSSAVMPADRTEAIEAPLQVRS